MSGGRGGGIWGALAWLTFPAVPVVLEGAYNGVLQFSFGDHGTPDPRDWGWFAWLTELGPLVGFGFLAGATLSLPDEPSGRRGPRDWLARRSVWVGLGPWAGFLIWSALVRVFVFVKALLPPGAFSWVPPPPPGWDRSWTAWALTLAAVAFVTATLCYGWLVFARAAILRARRLGRAREALRRGVIVASAFVGSLFGAFWAATEWWRAFFFDPRIVPVALIALSVFSAGGCGAPVTHGEVRRRELFRAMLLAWTFGLALLWRWQARSGPRPPR